MNKKILNCLLCGILTVFCCVPVFAVTVKAETVTYTMDTAVFNTDQSSPAGLKSLAFVDRSAWTFATYTIVPDAVSTPTYKWFIAFKKADQDPVEGGTAGSYSVAVTPENTILKCDVTPSGSLSSTVGTNGYKVGYSSNGKAYTQAFEWYAQRVFDFAFCPYDMPNITKVKTSDVNASDVMASWGYYTMTGKVRSNQNEAYTGRAPFGGLLGLGNVNQRMFVTPNILFAVPDIVRNLNILEGIESISTETRVIEPLSPDREFLSSQDSDGNPIITVNNDITIVVPDNPGGGGGSSGGGTNTNSVNVTVNNNNNLNQESMQYLNQIINNGGSGQDTFQNAIGNITGFLDIAENLGGLIGKILGFLPSWVLSIFSLVFSLLGVMVVFRLVHLFI